MTELEALIAEQARDMRSFRVFGVSLDAVNCAETPAGRLTVSDPCHGTIDGYANHYCRCEKCRLVWRDYQREYKRRWRAKRRAAA